MSLRKKIWTIIAGTACITSMVVPAVFADQTNEISPEQTEAQIAAHPGTQDEPPVLTPSKQEIQASLHTNKSSDTQQKKVESPQKDDSPIVAVTKDNGNREEQSVKKTAPAKKALTNKKVPVKSTVTAKSELVFDLKPQKADDVKPAEEPKQEKGFIARFIDATKGLIGRAMSWLGTRYVWGGFSTKGVDCSGLTSLLYQKEGIKLPHSAKLQYKMGKPVDSGRILPGDLVFFNTRGPLTHVGIYIGDGKFVHAANPRRGVRIDALSNAYYKKRFAGARRYLDVG